MRAEIITIGDELLIGQTVDTNATWIAGLLEANGVEVRKITTISDEREAINDALASALLSAELVLMTGGLGPTNDDITKVVLCDFFEDELELDQEVLGNVKALFARYGRRMNEWNERQALVPSKCLVLPNKKGTAPGICFEKKGRLVVSMPGVPFEMKHLMREQVIPLLKRKGGLPKIIHRTVVLRGIVESHLAELLESWEETLPSVLKLAYLPSKGMVRLRFTARGSDSAKLNEMIDEAILDLRTVAGDYFCSFQSFSLEQYVGELLKEKGATIATAESCTGGNIARLLTAVAGSSTYYKGSVVAYTQQVKQQLLAVSDELIASKGIVSEEVVRAMAFGIQSRLQTDYALATSGFAGPGGGTDKVPVGTVCVALASPNGVNSITLALSADRSDNIEKATYKALELLSDSLENK